jgi:DNA-binding PadR family transcriptional regulator
MNAKTLILAILNFQEATGYEIRKMCTEGPYSYFVDIGYGSIYPTLAKLEAEKLVTSRLEQDIGKPERKVYSITADGRAEFVGALAAPPALDKFKSEFLLVAMTAEYGNPATISKAIDARIEYLEGQLAMIKSHTENCDHHGTCWVGGYGAHVMKSDLEYLRNNKDALLALAGTAHGLPVAAE